MPHRFARFWHFIVSGLKRRPQWPTLAAPQDADFLDDLGGIVQSRFAGELANRARQQIQDANAANLLALAESAMLAGQRQAAAQLFVWTMISAYNARYGADQIAPLVAGANNVVLMIAGRGAELTSRTELALYCRRRAVAALKADGIRQPNIDEWTIAAFARATKEPADRTGAITTAIAELRLENLAGRKHYQPELGPTLKVLKCAQRLSTADNFARVAPAESFFAPFVTFVLLVAVVFGSVFIAYRYRTYFDFSKSSDFLDANSWPGRALCTALVAWPLLLVETWIFACRESFRKRTFYFISPWHLVAGRDPGNRVVSGIVAGEIVPFSRDWFFHIFQFVWIFLVVVAWLTFRDYDALPAWLKAAGAWDPSKPAELSAVLEWISRTNVWSDWLGIAFASLFLIGSIAAQIHIQSSRIAGKDIYWWDGRIGTTEWVVRLVMVGLDLFLAVFLIAKMVAMLFVAYKVATSDGLTISYFSFDGVGGLQHLTDVLMHLSWAVFLFGMLVFASLLLHWNLREYRLLDLSLVVAYVVVLAVALTPLDILEKKLTDEKERRLEALTTDPGPKLSDAGDYVKNLALVRDWPASALNVGILGNPVLPLGFQFLVVVIQFLVRAGKLPNLPIPGLGDREEDGKNAHDTS
jgi:hypothetical protein